MENAVNNKKLSEIASQLVWVIPSFSTKSRTEEKAIPFTFSSPHSCAHLAA